MVKLISQYNSFATAEITGSATKWLLKPSVLIYADSGSAIHEDNSHADNEITVAGRAISTSAYGIDSAGASTDITVAASGAVVGNTAGISTAGPNQSITNLGSIDGKGEGIHSQGESLSVDNSGAIGGAVGISFHTFGGDIINRANGIISGDAAIETDIGVGQRLRLVNDGTIIGMNDSYSSSGEGVDVLINRGTLTGNVHLGGGDDVFRNTGKLVGTVYGGTGSDTFVIDRHPVTIFESGKDAGLDTVQSSVSYTLGKGLENLELTGTGKRDGTGNGGANLLTGNSGANTLSGKQGSDILDGGLGRDTLSGGYGSDTFVFYSGDGHDTVTDFAGSSDTLDLSGMKGIADIQDLKDNHVVIGDGFITIINGTDHVILEGVGKAQLNAGNVDF